MKQGKIWGSTEEVIDIPQFSLHRLDIQKNHTCSEHKHDYKFNGFYVETGKLLIKIWKNDYDLVDKTILGPNEKTIVKPDEFHQFVALEDTIAYEYYWCELQSHDIVRRTCGEKI
jgi:quercetin dioxygenase-like cupin family protein